MRERLVGLLGTWLRRLRRLERREIHEFRAWIETTNNLVHVSALLFVPLLVATVTVLSNALQGLTYLLFPPLAAGTYTLFTDPKGEYAGPVRFVAGLTVGAIAGWVALEVSLTLGIGPTTGVPGQAAQVTATGAGIAVFLAGAATWLFDVEEPAAYSTALLGLLVPTGRQPAFVASVLLSTFLVSAVFFVWREQLYEHRADFLYQSTKGDDHVLVPMLGQNGGATAMLAARLAAAHDASKVVLLDVVDDETAARAERARLAHNDVVRLAGASDGAVGPADDVTDNDGATDGDAAADEVVEETIATLEERAATIETAVGVPCEVAVAVGDGSLAGTIRASARRANCDLVALPYDARDGQLRGYVRELFRKDIDVLVHRSSDGRTEWHDVMVPIRRASDVAHSMLDFALRLAGTDGSISVCTCIGPGGDRRRAEATLADLVGAFEGPFETRVSRAEILPFLDANASHYDIVFMGAGRDRTTASRIIAPPTFQRIQDLDADVAIVDRG